MEYIIYICFICTLVLVFKVYETFKIKNNYKCRIKSLENRNYFLDEQWGKELEKRIVCENTIAVLENKIKQYQEYHSHFINFINEINKQP